MAFDPTEILRPARAADNAVAHSWQGGTRSQSMQRLQIGLSGLVAMVLLVGLANLIITNAQKNQARVVPEAASTVAAKATAAPVTDPLAEAGVVPDMPVDTDTSRNAANDTEQGGAGPEVP